MIPWFTDEGLLPPGVHETSLEELEELMGWGRKRRGLLEGFEEALELMASCGVTRVYLDGSFVTDKDRPNDIDGCYDLESLGELITKARIASGLTQAQLSETLGMSQQQVQRYERDGWQKISVGRLAEVADALGLDVNIRARFPASNTTRSAGVG